MKSKTPLCQATLPDLFASFTFKDTIEAVKQLQYALSSLDANNLDPGQQRVLQIHLQNLRKEINRSLKKLATAGSGIKDKTII